MLGRNKILLLVCFLLLAPVSEGDVVKRSDDVDVGGLQNVVQQQAAQLAQQAAEINALKNKVEILSTAVAFTARLSHDDGNHGIPLSSHQVLRFDQIITNIGNAYDPSTGKFTAPVTGIYVFMLKMMVPNESSDLQLSVMKQGVLIEKEWVRNTGVSDDQGMTHVSTKMSAGEQAWVRQELGNGVRGAWETVFTGYLVQTL